MPSPAVDLALYCAACDRNVLDRADHLHVVDHVGNHLAYCDGKCRASFGRGGVAPRSTKTVQHVKVNGAYAVTPAVDLALRTINAAPRPGDDLRYLCVRATAAIDCAPVGHPQWLDARQREHAEAMVDALWRADFERAETWAQWINDPAAMTATISPRLRDAMAAGVSL